MDYVSGLFLSRLGYLSCSWPCRSVIRRDTRRTAGRTVRVIGLVIRTSNPKAALAKVLAVALRAFYQADQITISFLRFPALLVHPVILSGDPE